MTAQRVTPCPTCPWRLSSTIGGGFSLAKMRGLIGTVPAPGEGDGFRKIMACHSPDRCETPCIGYVAVEGYSNINVRLLVAVGKLDMRRIDRACRHIPMWRSFREMLEAYEAAQRGCVRAATSAAVSTTERRTNK